MLSFIDVAKVSDIRETLPPEAYKNIKPVDKITREEAVEFWKSEFSNETEHYTMEIYDRLISESFGRSEDEIDIDFDLDDQILSELEKFKDPQWQTMKESDKLDLAKEFVNKVSEKLGLERVPEIELLEEDNSTYGGYDPLKNVISINMNKNDNPLELVDTLMHELRHAYQYERAEVFETWQDALYRCNLDNYIVPEPLPNGGFLFFTDYYDQYVEVEARVFANKFTEAMR